MGWMRAHTRSCGLVLASLGAASSCGNGRSTPAGTSSTTTDSTATPAESTGIDDTGSPEPPPACTPSEPFGTWTELPPMSEAREYPALVLAPDGDVIVSGGRACPAADDVWLSSAERLDRETWTWSPIAEMPSERRGHEALALQGGTLLVLGGLRDDEMVATVDRYDIASDTWSTVGALPQPTHSLEAVVTTDGVVVVRPRAELFAEAPWFLSTDLGVTWSEVPHGTESVQGYDPFDLLALNDGRVLATNPGGATVFDPTDLTWWDQGGDPRWAGGAARVDNDEVVVITAPWAAYQADVGAFQMETSAALFDPATGERVSIGFVDCPSTSGKIEHLSMKGYGADIGQMIAVKSGSAVWFDRERGWRGVAALPETHFGSAKALLDDGSFLVVGGASDALDLEKACASAATSRWVPGE